MTIGTSRPNSIHLLQIYLRSARGRDLPTWLRERLTFALAPNSFGSLIRTVEHVHLVRLTLEDLERLASRHSRAKRVDGKSSAGRASQRASAPGEGSLRHLDKPAARKR